MTLADFRATYPQYDDLTDKELAEGLYKTHYSDMPQSEFYKAIGVSTTDRTWKEVGTDTLKQLGVGVGSTIEGVGTVGMLLGDDRAKAVKEFGNKMTEDLRGSYSQGLKTNLEQQQQYINQADSEAGKFWRTIESTATNPALLSTFIAESAPQMLAGGVVGRGVGAGAKLLGAGEQLAGRMAVGGAIGSNAVLQGADSAGNTYDTLMKLDDNTWSQNPQFQALVQQGIDPLQAKDEISKDLARRTLGESGAISLATQGLFSKFGGNAFERALVGRAEKGTVGGIVGKGLAEAGSEAIEEGGGQASSNYNVNQVTPTSLFKDVGQSAGQGFITGLAMGGTGGAVEAFKPMRQLVEEEKAKIQSDRQSVFGDIAQRSDAINPNLTDENLYNDMPNNQAEVNNAPTSPIIDDTTNIPRVENQATQAQEVQPQEAPQVDDRPLQLRKAEQMLQMAESDPRATEEVKNTIRARYEKLNADYELGKQNNEALESKTDEKDLIVQHNLSENNLHYALKNGGMTVPSLAITKKDTPLTGFGEISLIGNKDLADPKGKAGTKVFGADIYSPRHPREEREYKTSDIRKMDKSLEKYSRILQDGSINDSRDVQDLRDNRAMQMKFLEEEKGIKLDIPTAKHKDEENTAKFYPDEYKKSIQSKGIDWLSLYKNNDFREKVLNDLREKFKARGKDLDPITAYGEDGFNNIARERAQTIDQIGRNQGKPDFYAMRSLLRNEIDKHSQEYNDYVEKFTEPYAHKSYFYDNNKKKAYSTDAVIKYLSSNLRGGENFNYGAGNVRAMVTPQFKSIDEIKKAKNRLVTYKEFEEIKDSLSSELLSIASEIASKNIGNTFTANDIATEFIQDYAKRGKRAISDYAVNVNSESLEKIDAFLNKLKEAPTEYFEGKITRQVQPREFHTAVVPDNASQKTLDALKQQGLNIKTYKSGDEKDRAKAIKEASEENDLAFSKGYTQGTTKDIAIQIVNKTLGKSKARQDVEIVQTFDDLPKGVKESIRSADGNTRGVFFPETGKSYLIADKISEQEVKGVLLHELFHRAINKKVAEKGGTRLEVILGDKKLNEISKEIKRLESQGDKDVLTAIRHIENIEVPERVKLEETLAYILQNETNKYSSELQQFVKNVIKAIKDFVRRVAVSMGVEPNWLVSQMTVEDIANVLRSYALDEDSVVTNDKPLFSKLEDRMKRLMEWHKDSHPLTKNEDGMPKVFYHGTDANAKFNTFKGKMIYFTDNLNTAKGFSEDASFSTIKKMQQSNKDISSYYNENEELKHNVYEAYINLKKPLVVECETSFWDEIPTPKEMGGKGTKTTDQISKWALKNGYDGVVFKNIVDGSGYKSENNFVAFTSNQIKSVNNKGTFDESNPNILFSKATVKVNQQSKLDKAKEWLKDVNKDTVDTLGIKTLLKLITLDQKAEVFGKVAPELDRYNDILFKKQGEANKISNVSAEIAERVRKWAGKNKAEADKVFKLMGETTRQGIDPSKSFSDQTTKIKGFNTFIEKSMPTMDKIDEGSLNQDKYNYLKAKYDNLSEDGKEIFNRVRDHYSYLSDRYYKALEDKLKASEMPEDVRKKIVQKMRLEHEARRLQPYFPLARYGDYTISAKNAKGDKVFEMFEKPSERDKRVLEMKEQGYTDIDTSAMVNKKANVGADTQFMSGVFDELTKYDPEVAKDLEDSIYQMYLKFLPSVSARKQFIHRKGIEGYSDDALRVLADKSFHMSKQIANLRYLGDMENEMKGLEKRVKETGDPKLKTIYEDLQDTHEHIVNPQFSAIAQAMTSAGFYYYLSSPSTGVINVLQTPMVTFPKLVGKYGLGKATKALTKAMADASKISVASFKEHMMNTNNATYDSLKGLSADEADAIKEFFDNGAVDVTLAHDLAGMGEDYGSWNYGALTNIKRVVAVPQHYTEVYNRLSTLLATYRLARDNGDADPIKTAIKVNKQTNFNYTAENRASWMRNPYAKVITQFKNYSQHMTYFIVKNSIESLKGDKEALKTMGALMVMVALAGGVKGLPLQIPFALLGGDADDELYSWIKEHFGDNADLVWRGALNKVLGVDIGSRVGLGDLFIRSPQKELQGKELFQYYTEQVLGASYSIIANMVKGLGKIKEGEVYRGTEDIMPKPIKDIMQSIRFAKEGARNLDYSTVKSDFTPYELGAKSVGFSPESLSKQYESNSRQQRAVQRAEQEKQDIYKMFRKSEIKKDDGLWKEAIEKVREYNTKYPTVAIQSEDIQRVLKNNATKVTKETMGGGINIDKKYTPITEKYK